MDRMNLYTMSGAGNLFVVLDGRKGDAGAYRGQARIRELCREYGTDGLMILSDASGADFSMEFFNPDGSGGMMCGNGGRCIAAFADYLGIKGARPLHYDFAAPDGMHSADILSRPGSGNLPATGKWTIRLGMIDVHGITPVLGGFFLNTGTRHFVKFVPNADAVDVEKEGKELRLREEFAPEGTNVNFVCATPDGLYVRTFEKGVEGETLACGTGITASAIAAWNAGLTGGEKGTDGSIVVKVKARRDLLSVDFVPERNAGIFRKVHLTGPAEFV